MPIVKIDWVKLIEFWGKWNYLAIVENMANAMLKGRRFWKKIRENEIMLVLKEFDIKFVNILNLVNIRFFRWIY